MQAAKSFSSKMTRSFSRKNVNFASLPIVRSTQKQGFATANETTASRLQIQSQPATSFKSQFSTQAASITEMIHAKTKNNKVVIFSKSRCPFCMQTKRLFNGMEIEAEVIELDEIPDGYAIQKELLSITGQRTVPNVFVDGKHMGGNDDVQAAARTGQLQKMLS